MSNIVRLSLLLFFSTPASHPLWAQQSSSRCGDMKYKHHNMVDYSPLRISAIRGTAKDVEGFAVWNACIGICSESDLKTVATGEADSDGRFEIRNIPNGKYILVVSREGFCAANVPITLKNRSRGKKKLVAIMKPSAVDTCSFVEWK